METSRCVTADAWLALENAVNSTEVSRKDYYLVLGVGREADERAIKSAYRRLALQYHPDKNPDDPTAAALFREATEAYEILGDHSKRTHYDRFGVTGEGAFGAGFGFASGSVGDIFGDIFSDIFGGKTKTKGRDPGRDLRYNLELSFEEAAFGVEKKIVVPRWKSCMTCVGTGAKPGSAPQFCQACGGSGEIRVQQGFFSVAKTCGYCKGRGRVIREPCADCQGVGRSRVESEFTVKIPPGADENTVLKFTGEGEPSPNTGAAGDLRVNLTIKAHPLFERAGEHLTCRVPISFTQAALGTALEVPTLDGRVRMKVPPGTQSGRVFRLKGKGLPTKESRGGRGDQLVTVHVEVPLELSERQKQLIRELEEIATPESNPEQKSFWDKVRELFAA